MDSQHGLERSAAVPLRRYQLAIRALPRPAIEIVVEGVVDVDLLVDGVGRVHHVVHVSDVIEPRRIFPATDDRIVDEDVVAVAADYPYRDTASNTPLDGRPIVAAVQVDADLLRLARVEPPSEIGRVASRLDANVHDPIGGAHHRRLVVGLRAMNVCNLP